MHRNTISRLGAAIIVGVALYGTGAAAQVRPQSASGQLPTCTVTVSGGDSVNVATSPIVLQTKLTAALGDSISVSFPVESKITVVKVAPAANNEPKAVEVTINTSEAKPGKWPVAFKSKSGECSGELKILGAP
jgi:hypothetical protein